MTNRRQFIANACATSFTLLTLESALAQTDTESTWARINRTKTLRIGAVGGAAPYYQKDLASGEWQGFMIDFAKSLAASLNAKLDINETTWGNAVLDLQANKLDVFFGLNPTPARMLVVDFSDPLFNNAFVLLARKDFNPGTWAELNDPNVKIAVDIGSSHDQMVTKTCPKAQIIRLEKSADASLAVQTGRADAQVLVTVLALTVVSKNPSIGHVVLPTPVQATTTNLGFRKEADRSWVEYVDKWIAQTRAGGKVKDVVLANLQKLSGVRPEQIPAGMTF
jgi:polar amino acid transport system substrate-binding protein